MWTCERSTRGEVASVTSVDRKKPCCILDLDQTVLTREPMTSDPFAGARLYFGRESDKGNVTGDIMPDCKETVRELAHMWNFVAVTARWGGITRCRQNTETWLRAHGMEMPVFYASWPYPTDRPRVDFKASAIRHIQSSGKYGEILVGVGDRPSDVLAYLSTGLKPFVVTDALGEVDGGADGHMRALRKLDRGDNALEYFGSTDEASAWQKVRKRLEEVGREFAYK